MANLTKRLFIISKNIFPDDLLQESWLIWPKIVTCWAFGPIELIRLRFACALLSIATTESGRRGGLPSAVRRPIGHHLAALVEVVGATVGCLDLVGDSVRQGRFSDLSRVAGLLCCPVAEGRAEAVHGVGNVGVTQDLE